jgi:AhpC/TSA family
VVCVRCSWSLRRWTGPRKGGNGMATILTPGTPAPDFTLHVTPDQKLSLSELRGRPVILAFYPADWSPVCGDQMGLYNEILPEFQKYGAELIGGFGRWRVVPRSVCERSAPTFSSACGLRAEGAGRADIRGLSERRGRLRTSPVCNRQKRNNYMELSLTDCSESWGGWDPSGTGRLGEIGESYEYTKSAG